ncbi:MAG: hypothetical protein K6F53_04830 [Lachnospiraceae bacterium]|nr:hypothetical protein [Lachnospiraceae bacterium]
MDYYRRMLFTMISLLKELGSRLLSDDSDHLIRCAVLLLGSVFLFAAIRMLLIRAGGVDPRYGTVAFWIVSSAFTFGIAAIAFLLTEAFPDRPGVHRRPRQVMKYLILPSYMSVCFFYILRLTPLSADALVFSELIGLVTFVYLIASVILSDSEPAMYFEMDDNEKAQRSIPPEELKRYLLIKESEDQFLHREYMKYDGSILRVIEIESTVFHKICDCLAGLLIWIMATTPYVPWSLERIIRALG